MSFSEKPAALSCSAIAIAWDSLFAIPNTAFAMLSPILSLDFELIVYVARPGDRLSFARDSGFLFFGLEGTAQRDAAVRADDLHVMRQHGKRMIFDHRPAYPAGEFH